jgi:methyl-accepting chemotaxis protein
MALHITIRQKLTGFSLMGLGFVLVVGAAGLLASQRQSSAAQHMADNTSALKHQMEADMMHDALRGDAIRAMLSGVRQEKSEEKSIRGDLAEHSKTFTVAIKTLSELPLPDSIKSAATALRPDLSSYLALSGEIVNLAFDHPEQAQAKYPAFQAAFSKLEGEMEHVNQMLEKQSQEVEAESHAAAWMANAVIMGVMLVAALACISGGYVLTRGILGPIAVARRVAETVAAGDLTSDIRVDSQDEIGQLLQALKAMNGQLAEIVGSVRLNGDSIATGSTQISSGNADLSHRTEQQAANLQQTSTSMEELTSTVKLNAEAAQEATALAGTASQVAVKGGEMVSQVVGTMDEITAASRKINDIIGVIDGIAFQTNILALNAAVEAARAGEQGRGFAVVAGEVRSLARRSAEAAKEIKHLINNSVEKVENGSRQVGEAGQTMGEIVNQVRRVAELISDISVATQEQSKGVGQISRAVSELDEVTQQNAALVEQSAAAAESLKNQAQSLVASVQVFKLLGG